MKIIIILCLILTIACQTVPIVRQHEVTICDLNGNTETLYFIRYTYKNGVLNGLMTNHMTFSAENITILNRRWYDIGVKE